MELDSTGGSAPCPEGWRVPDDFDWMILEQALKIPDHEILEFKTTPDRGESIKAKNNLITSNFFSSSPIIHFPWYIRESMDMQCAQMRWWTRSTHNGKFISRGIGLNDDGILRRYDDSDNAWLCIRCIKNE